MGGGSGACQIRRHAASSCRSLAAGPPFRAAIQVLVPMGAGAPPSPGGGKSGTRAGGAGAPPFIPR
eukprot:6564145-Lingulodinium_polyedra.AAC.1